MNLSITRRHWARLLLLAALGLAAGAHAAPSAAEQARIDKLIDAVAANAEMKFIRNGSEYTPAQAGKFLRGKMNSMGGEVTTCEDFIERIASRSSTSGKDYQVKMSDGKMMPSGEFMRQELARLERKNKY